MFELENKSNCEAALKRVEAWFHGEVLDRAPVRFSKHNAQYGQARKLDTDRWPTLEARWFDEEYRIDSFLESLAGNPLRAETFPVFWPDLGPDVYAAFFGGELTYGENTSWSHPLITDLDDPSQVASVSFDANNRYLRKVETITQLALEKCRGRALIGLTSWTPGIDAVASWLGPENLCMALYTHPEAVKELVDRTLTHFHPLADRFYDRLAANNLPSVGWMGIPCVGKGHIAQTDFANMISPEHFAAFCQPTLKKEFEGMDKIIFHMDGKGVAVHVEALLAEPGIDAIQWVQGVGDDEPILQWIPLIKKIQQAGKALVIDLKVEELEPFISRVGPQGIHLFVSAEENIQEAIIKRLLHWRA